MVERRVRRQRAASGSRITVDSGVELRSSVLSHHVKAKGGAVFKRFECC